MKTFIFNIDPVSKPRQTKADRWKKRSVVLKYRAYADEMRLQAKNMGYELQESLTITFVIPFPKSYPEKKRLSLDGKPHQLEKFDLDNLEKAFCDALSKKDGFVWEKRSRKIWGRKGKIIVESHE